MTDLEVGASVQVNLAAALGKVTSELFANRQELRELRRDVRRQGLLPHFTSQPFYGLGGGNQVYATGSTLWLVNNGPEQGKIWEVRRLVLGGAAANTAGLTGTAYVFCGATPPYDLSLGGFIDYSSTWSPAPPATWSRGQFPVAQGESVFIAIVGGTNGATYGASMQVEEYDRNRYSGASQLRD